MSQTSLLYWPIETTASVYYREEQNPSTNVGNAFAIDRRGVSIQQEKQLGNSYVWNYGYRYERARTFDPLLGAAHNEFVAVSPLTSTFTREGRDEALDASRGSFVSQAFSYSPSWLGSDVSFSKYYGQYFHYVPLQTARRKPFTNEILRPRLVYAVGARLGLEHGFGGPVPASERFYAGGSTTLRGFEQNAVGPIGAGRIPTGGEALLVLNNELRFPFVSIVDGVVFVDVGNVFAKASNFSFADLRESAGFGVRLRTSWFLLRGDYGFVLDPRPGERTSRFYFSIGQAF
jgi:outer membrane protein assembly factor BamA